MDPKLRRKLIVSGAGLAVFVGLFAVLYIFVLGPRWKEWRQAREEITKREKRLDELRKAFANVRTPQDELKVLEQEIMNLGKSIQQVEKVKKAGTETISLPKELHDPDPAIRRELYKDYMKQVMDVAGSQIKDRLKTAQILPPDLVLYEDLEQADEVAYYMNRAGGLQGVVNALAQSRKLESTLVIDGITMENYKNGIKRREGAVNVLSYLLKMTLDTQTLVSFLYNLREQDGFYYVDQIQINPRTSRGTTQQLAVEARVNTTMVFQSQVQSQVKTVLAQAGKTATGKKGGGDWMSQLARAMKEEMLTQKTEERKWYEFWKWFKKD